MGLSRTISNINGNFGRKSQNFPTPVYFAPLLKGFSMGLELGIGARGKKKTSMMALQGCENLTMSSAVWMQSTNVTDRQTDGQTPGDSKNRA